MKKYFLFYGFLVFIIFSMIFSINITFFMNEKNDLIYLTWIFPIFLMAIIIKSLDGGILKKYYKANQKNIFFKALVLLFAIPIFHHIWFMKYSVYILHLLSPKSQSSIKANIKQIKKEKGCKKRVYIQGYDFFNNGRFCGTKIKNIDTLKSIILHEEKSTLGFEIKRVDY